MANEYSGKDVQVTMLGRPTAVTAISYQAQQEKQNFYVLGQKKPYSTIKGRKQYEGSISLPQSEFEALLRSLPAGTDPLDIAAFDIVIVYVSEDSSLIVTDILKGCEFTEYEKSMENEDDNMIIEMPLKISDVLLNVR